MESNDLRTSSGDNYRYQSDLRMNWLGILIVAKYIGLMIKMWLISAKRDEEREKNN